MQQATQTGSETRRQETADVVSGNLKKKKRRHCYKKQHLETDKVGAYIQLVEIVGFLGGLNYQQDMVPKCSPNTLHSLRRDPSPCPQLHPQAGTGAPWRPKK